MLEQKTPHFKTEYKGFCTFTLAVIMLFALTVLTISAPLLPSRFTQNELFVHFQLQDGATNCACFKMNNWGMGSDLHTFGQALWNMKTNHIKCFFVEKTWIWDPHGELFDWPWTRRCKKSYDWRSQTSIAHLSKPYARSQALEFTFTFLRPEVYSSARIAAHKLQFSPRHLEPPLVTVHIRWGDKHQEMDLFPIEAYTTAVKAFNLTKPSVFVTTEDVNAISEFKAQAPKQWNVYTYSSATSTLSSGKTGHPMTFASKEPKAGYHAIISLLVGFQSSYFVVTLGSNWSRVISEMCTIYVSKQCTLTDLSPKNKEYW